MTARYVRRVLRVTLCPVVGRSRLAVITCRTVCSGVFHHWVHHLWPQGAVPPRLKPSSEGLGLSPGVWGAPKRGMPTGSEAFLELPVALGFGPATGPTLKTALCHIRTLVGRRINNGTYGRQFAEKTLHKEFYWSFSTYMLHKHGVFYSSEIPEVTWYEPLYNTM